MTIKQLKNYIKRIEAALEREHIKNVAICARVGWGAGMRRVKIGPSGGRERELANRLEDYRAQLSKMEGKNDYG